MPRDELELLQGTLDVLVLKALSWGTRHGHAVASWIRTTTDDDLSIDDAALYTALHRLEHRGLVESEWGLSDKQRRAKFYVLTDAGRRELRREAARWNRYAGAVSKVLTATRASAAG